ncbi:thioredoxin family protein [Maritimibacter sp. DP1N21-5]|uniref:DUF1223 domain-containing protein n=1 Tax=Maritimibacter sp. DP1N21-5 TaxID=2836867 RepID=UPI001C4676DF|nr:DUF1223 domain-containing protein [Maritimibacter sp. DP1N21-5]MBV7410147.1 DUF1223 domain-containing protein [Maritimibacter sp. DP1N21-5]
MRGWIGAGAFGVAALVATIGSANESPVVLVELFTSQGCNSCPPADELLLELATRDDVLPLALHVDYWDYIGWADVFARPEHTTRQKAYAHRAGASTIYTPQMVVGGTDHVVGYKPMKLMDYMEVHEAALADVDVDADFSGGSVTIRCVPKEGKTLPGQILIDLVRYNPQETVNIEHGENAGKTMTYANIVESWDHVATWDGQGEITIDAPADAEGRYALVLQEPGPGRVLAAYKLD